MEDYEIRDVMNRATTPDVEVEFGIYIVYADEISDYGDLYLSTILKNQGSNVINYYKLKLQIINGGWVGEKSIYGRKIKDSMYGENVTVTMQEYFEGGIDFLATYRSTEVLFPKEELNLSDKIVWTHSRGPGSTTSWIDFAKEEGWVLRWFLYADNMPPKKGEIPFYELKGF